MKTSKVFLNIASFFCFIYFSIYIFSLVFIPIGIYCFIAGKTFSTKASNIDDMLKVDDKIFKTYTIFSCIFVFPFGFFALIAYFMLTGNNIKVKNFDYTSSEKLTNADGLNEKALTENSQDEVSPEIAEPVKNEEKSEEEKIEMLHKLENFKEKGLITEDELEQAKEQLFGKKEQ